MFLHHVSFQFISGSSDRTLQIVDMRVGNYKKSQMKINAHTKDVNVFDWNRAAKHLIVTGSDDCDVKVWDLRMHMNEANNEELLKFNWHTEPITSIKFQPNEESVIAVSSEDNTITIWDMSVEN
jgi:ribosome assembly protein RRB1